MKVHQVRDFEQLTVFECTVESRSIGSLNHMNRIFVRVHNVEFERIHLNAESELLVRGKSLIFCSMLH